MSFDFASYRREWFTDLTAARRDLLAGIVVALALIPEAIGFSIIAGVDPRVGLYASVTIAMVIAFIGGRPGMISAATAAVAVLVTPLVRDHGVDYLFAATILMGLFQIAAGVLRLHLLMQFVSRSVITGFVNALAILVLMAQLPQLIGANWHTYALVAGGLAIIYGLPRLTSAVPSTLVAVVVLSVLSIILALPVTRVGDMGLLPDGLQEIFQEEFKLTRDEILDREEIAVSLCKTLCKLYPDELCERYKMTREEIDDAAPHEVFELIGRRRGFLIAGGEVDFSRTAVMLLDEFRAAKIGRMTLEFPPAAQKQIQETEQ